MSKVEASAADLYARITGRILEQLEKGVRPWTRPWSAEHLGGRVTRPLRVTGEPYQGINVLLLWMEAAAAGHPSPTWMTYRQAQTFGAQVRKGERGCSVVYFGSTQERGADEGAPEPAGDDAAREVRFLKTYTVFNLAQIDGLPAPFSRKEAPLPCPTGSREDRSRRRLPQRARRRGSAWRGSGLLLSRRRPHPAPAAGGLPRRGGLLHDVGP